MQRRQTALAVLTASCLLLAAGPVGLATNGSLFLGEAGYTVGLEPAAIAVADLNGDGLLDLAVANLGSSGSQASVSVLLGNGDGTFQEAVNYSAGPCPGAIAAGDFNGDGAVDLAVSNFCGANTVSVLLGNGDGTFQPPLTLANGGGGGVAVGDLNGDSNLDLVVANDNGGATQLGTVSVFLGNGDGTFQPAVQYGAGVGPFSLALADFNADGALDIAVVNNRSNNVSILLGNGRGLFAVPADYSIGLAPTGLAVADFNGDGVLDLATTAQDKVDLLFGNGDGTFRFGSTVGTGPGPQSLMTDDFNGDGLADLAVSTGGQNASLQVLLGNGDGTFQAAIDYAYFPYPYVPAAGDFNGDGKPDLCTLVPTGNPPMIDIHLNQGALPAALFSPASLSFPTQTVGTVSAVEHITLTNNGNIALTVSSVGASGPYMVSNECGSNVAMGASCNLNVQFRPTARGTQTGSVTVSDDAPGSPQTLALTGTGTLVNLSPSSIAFGNVGVGQSASASVTVTNLAHNQTLTISSITAEDDPPFSQTNNCGTSLGPRASCAVTVTFAPATTGTFGGSVTVKDNGGGTIQTVSLSGTGTAK